MHRALAPAALVPAALAPAALVPAAPAPAALAPAALVPAALVPAALVPAALAACLLAATTARAQAPRIAIVVTDGGAAAAAQLERIVDAPAGRAPTVRAGCALAPVVVEVGAADGVAVTRCADGVRLSRGVSEGAVAASPYAAALVASELLELLGSSPPAHRSVPRVGAPRGLALGVHLQLGVVAGGSADGSAFVVAPRAAADLVLGRRGDGPWLAVGAFVAPFGLRSYGVDAPAARDLAYARHELGLRVLVGDGRLGSAAFAVGVEAGGSLTDVEVHGPAGMAVGAGTRLRFVAGVTGELRYPIVDGLGVVLGLEALLSPDPVRWLVGGVPIVEEGAVWLRAHVGLTWDA